MMEAGAPEAEKLKKHSPFVQVVFRKTGESFDLTGKAMLGFGGFKSLLSVHRLAEVDWPHLLIVGAVGSVALAVGIYLEAKAEET